jgi:hypothetical protein
MMRGSCMQPKATEVVILNFPRGAPWSLETASFASSIAASAVELFSYSAEPASVRRSRRVVRWSRRAPSTRSRRFTHLLTCEVDSSSLSAARVKLPSRTTAAKIAMSPRVSGLSIVSDCA